MAASQSYQISQSIKTEPIHLIRNRSNDRPRHRAGEPVKHGVNPGQQRHAAADNSSWKTKQHGCSCCGKKDTQKISAISKINLVIFVERKVIFQIFVLVEETKINIIISTMLLMKFLIKQMIFHYMF